MSHDGTYKVEYHHIHPRASLRERYSKAEINDLANLAFISDKANRKISSRPPATYFAELEALDPSFLTGHMVPTAEGLRSLDAYPDLIAERRALLAAAMNELLETFRPTFLDAAPSGALGETTASLVIEAFGTSVEADDVLLLIRARLAEHEAAEVLRLAELEALLCDLADGRGGEIEVGSQVLAIDADTEFVEIPVGPLLVGGTLGEWRKVLDRELGDLSAADQMPATSPAEWTGPLHDFSILDSE